jgi:uncharacterized protein YndB with AHSA1/START domain/ketosteroid isomerase-like protein
METNTVKHEVTFCASPSEVFETLTDAKKHAAFTGMPADIDRRVGGKFILYGGQLNGTIIELDQDRRIVQDWRASKWPAGHFSRLSFALSPLAEGKRTQLSMTQTGVPADQFDDINQGWQVYYWTKMANYFRDEKVAVVRRFMEEFKNKANLDIVDELFTPNFALHLPGVSLPPVPASQKAVGKAIFDAFSDIRVTVNDTIVEGDRVVERHTAHATHVGEFNGVPATGRKVFWTENHIYRLKNGKIAEAWSEVSFHDLIAQLTKPVAAAAPKAR